MVWCGVASCYRQVGGGDWSGAVYPTTDRYEVVIGVVWCSLLHIGRRW